MKNVGIMRRLTQRRMSTYEDYRRIAETNDSSGAYFSQPEPYRRKVTFLYIPLTIIIWGYVGFHCG